MKNLTTPPTALNIVPYAGQSLSELIITENQKVQIFFYLSKIFSKILANKNQSLIFGVIRRTYF
jgi:hypothetical protein